MEQGKLVQTGPLLVDEERRARKLATQEEKLRKYPLIGDYKNPPTKFAEDVWDVLFGIRDVVLILVASLKNLLRTYAPHLAIFILLWVSFFGLFMKYQLRVNPPEEALEVYTLFSLLCAIIPTLFFSLLRLHGRDIRKKLLRKEVVVNEGYTEYQDPQ
jgi:hypothetical protein